MNSNRSLVALLTLSLSVAAAPLSFAQEHAHAAAAESAVTAPAPKLQATLRALWQGHVQQTRNYALAVHDGNAGEAALAADGVVANAKEIAAAVASFYGDAAGAAMLQLLAGHWGAVKSLTDAGLAGDGKAQQRAMEVLTTNASEIASFLAGANPNLPEDAVRGLLVAHGAHHAAQIQNIMRGDMQAEGVVWQAMQVHMDTIADALAGAIAKQFPERVS